MSPEPAKERGDEKKKIATLLEDLSLLEDYIQEFFAFSPLPLCSISPNGVILEVNPAFERTSGYKIYEIVGKALETFFTKERIDKLSKETLEKGSVKAKELSLLHKEGKEVTVSAFSQVRRNPKGEAIGYFVAFFDLTEVKKTENELKETQSAILNILDDVDEARIIAEAEKDKTLTVITNLADGLLVFDKEGRLILVNPQAKGFFGLETVEMVGKSVDELSKSPQTKSLTGLIAKKGKIKKVNREEIPISETLVLEISTVPMEREGEMLGTLVIIHDITREKRVERLKTEFVSLAAHQLRTPLSAIKWTLRMLLDGDLGKITTEQKDYVDKTAQSTERMIDLVNDLLNVTRIEEGRYLYNPTPLAFEPIIQSLIDAHRDLIDKKKIQFKFNKPKEELPPIKVDEEKIQLAIQNLLDNALRYTPPGGKVTVSLKYHQDKKRVEATVKDSGIGIPKDQQERVFSKFFRGDNAVRMKTEGTGLGLFITKHIIEAHGGEIWFESEEREGTTFYLTLPVVKEPERKEVTKRE